MIPGLVATGFPLSGACGPGSLFSGTSFLMLTGGNLLPSGSCTFSVNLAVPASALPGTYVNTTSPLRRTFAPTARPASAILKVIESTDDDGDGVTNNLDRCPGTRIPEGVPTIELRPNRYALVNGDRIFDTAPPNGNGNGPGDVFTVDDTAGCSCEQIIVAMSLGSGHEKFGCSIGAMREWVTFVNP